MRKAHLLKQAEKAFHRFTPKYIKDVKNTTLEADAVRLFVEKYFGEFKYCGGVIKGRILAKKARTISDLYIAIDIARKEFESWRMKNFGDVPEDLYFENDAEYIAYTAKKMAVQI